MVRVNSSIFGCGGLIEGSEGTITSPGYPNSFPHHIKCTWVIRGPVGRSIQLNFEDLDLDVRQVIGNHSYCRSQMIMAHSSASQHPQTEAVIEFPNQDDRLCGNQIPEPVLSSSNSLTLRFYTFESTASHRGFKVNWNAYQAAACGGIVTRPSTVISPPLQPTGNYSANTLCEWTLRPPANSINPQHTTVFTTEKIFMEPEIYGHCYDQLVIYTAQDPSLANGMKLGEYCGEIQSRVRTVSPFPFNQVVFFSDQSYEAKGFNLTYQMFNCGGHLRGTGHVVTSPNYPQNYPSNYDCAWLLEYEEGSQIEVNIYYNWPSFSLFGHVSF